MNVFAIIILAAILLDFLIGIITNILNLKSLSKEVPAEFAGIYDTETYAKSQQYTKVRTQFGFITGTISRIPQINYQTIAPGLQSILTIKNYTFKIILGNRKIVVLYLEDSIRHCFYTFLCTHHTKNRY